MNNHCYPFINTPLPYDYNALEPYIDEKTMYLHHNRHLQTYIDNLNAIIEKNSEIQRWSLDKMLIQWCGLPCEIQRAIRNNAGGVFNHRFFFEGMKKGGSALCDGCLAEEMKEQFGSFHKWKERFKEAALSVFGSGYAWLITERGRLKITVSANQDTPLAQGQCPLLNIDVWEHAYYLKHYNMRAAYIEDWFHVVDWEKVEQRYLARF